MSKMLDSTIEEIVDLYYSGMKPATIAATLRVSPKLVTETINDLEHSNQDEYTYDQNAD